MSPPCGAPRAACRHLERWYKYCVPFKQFSEPAVTNSKGGTFMAIWKDINKVDGAAMPFEPIHENGGSLEPIPAPARHNATSRTDSVIGAGLVIEGKIEGEGDIH